MASQSAPVTNAESQVPPSLAERLRAAISEKGISQRQLARLIAGEDADERRVENERRQLGKYLAGQHAPSISKAQLIARLLDKPENYFIDERLTARRLPELVGEVYELVADISSLIDEQLGVEAAKGPPWAVLLHDRLRALEGAVSDAGQAATDAIARLEAAIVRLSQQLEPEARQDREAAQ